VKVGAGPTLDRELDIFAQGVTTIVAMDEVGRGSVFGPCSVGAVVIDRGVGPWPGALRDSKLLSARARVALVGPLREWVRDAAVGDASAAEIDEFGLTCALRLAGRRALAQLVASPEVVLLDGSFDWLSTPRESPLVSPNYPVVHVPEVRTQVKADLTCASVAAASVFAKVHRDAVIEELASLAPGYDLSSNKGYLTVAHAAGLRRLGPSRYHRHTWNLPTTEDI